MKLTITGILILITAFSKGHSQEASDTVTLNLHQVVEMAKSKSIAAKQASTIKKTRYWQYRTYRSNYQPQLSLAGILPSYNKTFAEVLQPDGSILFHPIHNNNSSLNLSFSQTIASTGATVFGTTQLQRFDDFERKNKLYNSVPFGIGIIQPLFQFNSLKWDKRIEPLLYAESVQAYIEDMEDISINACSHYFDLLLAQVNFEIAETNMKNTQNILLIAKEKFELGKITKNEILQLRLEELKAQKALGLSKRDMQIATLNLKSYVGLQDTKQIALMLPAANIDMNVSSQKVLEEAMENRSDAIAFQRRIAEAKRDVAKAKGDNGLNASLTAQVGFSKSGTDIFKAYQAPQGNPVRSNEGSAGLISSGRQHCH
jgi:outer membrane protein TolC